MHNTRSNRRKTKKGRQPRSKNNTHPKLRDGYSQMSPPSKLLPSETFVTLTWPSAGVITSAGAQLATKGWKTNDCYDVDPIFGSTDTPGFALLSDWYAFYRVVSYTSIIEVCNTQNFPVSIYFINTNQDYRSSASSFELFAANPYGRIALLPAQGTAGSYKKFRFRHTISQIVGSSAPETDDNYRALVNASPADLTWLAVGINTHSATNLLSTGCSFQMKHTMNVRFYGRNAVQI